MNRHMTRRDSLKTLGAIGLGLIANDTQSVPAEDRKISPEKGYIDAHVHVWSPDIERFPLAREYRKEDMNPPSFTPEELLEQLQGTGVDRVNLIQMSYYGFDNSYMLEAISKYPETFVGTAIVDPFGQDLEGEMERFSKQNCFAFRIHPSLTKNPPATWLQPEPMKHMFSIASERQLALSALIDLEALPELDRMCRQYPDAPVIIDHLCRLGSGERYPINEENMNVLTAMAGHRNVHIKIGAFYALGKGTPPYLDLLPLIRRVVEAFSPERCLWETDCPFQLNKATYEDSLALIRDHADFLSPSDKHWILKGTAEKILFRI